MRTLATLVVVLCLTVVASADPIISVVQPEGDGQSGRDRYGFAYGWESSGFNASASPNWSGHWYESSWASGSNRTVYMQVALPETMPAADDVEAAWLYLYVTEIGGNGSSIRHRTDASTATGLASQELAGNALVMDLTPAAVGGTGWLAIDVTEFIRADLASGHAWAVFDLPPKSYSSFTFHSGDNTDGFAPYLSVAAVPEPGTLALLILGGSGLLLRRRRV